MNEGRIPRRAGQGAGHGAGDGAGDGAAGGRPGEARHWSLRSPHEIAARDQATVLELRRLQQAFDHEFPPAAATAGPARVPPDAQPDAPPPAGPARGGGLEGRATRILAAGKLVVDYLRGSALRGPSWRGPSWRGSSWRGSRFGRDAGPVPAADRPSALIVGFPLRRGTSPAPVPAPSDARDAAPPRPDRGPALDALRDAARRAVARSRRVVEGLVDPAPRAGSPGDASPAGLAGRIERSLAREFRVGLAVVGAGASTLGAWAALAPLAGAVTLPGSLVVETNVKKVQHPTGGTVAAIVARDGMHVRAGDPVVRLDGTQTRTNYQVVTAQLDQLRVHIARLVAERDGADEPLFPADLVARAAGAAADADDARQLLASERSLFDAHRSSQRNQKDLLRNHVVQFESEIDGLKAQIRSDSTQADLTDGELKGVETLHDRQLVPLQRVTTLQREAARLEGAIGQATSAAVQAQAKIAEAKLQIDQIDQLFRSEVLKELRESQDKASELGERRTAARDQLDRVEIRAPVSGTVQDLAVHTIGGVVSPAETIMEIVPDDALQVEARVPPGEIDHVRLGQAGLIRFSAFNQRTTPQLRGAVSYVSADLVHDSRTNAAFYSVKVDLAPDQRRRLGGLQLVSGMPAEVFLQTGSRSMVSYLFKPIADQLKRTFSEP